MDSRSGRHMADLLTIFENRPKQGFLRRLCYYFFVSDKSDELKYPSIKVLREHVLASEGVHNSIQSTIYLKQDRDNEQKDTTQTEKRLRMKALKFANEMIGTVTSNVISFCGWLYLNMLKRVCSSVHYNPSEIEAIRKASEGDTPIVYMPLHCSHLDYILVSLILFHTKVRVPYIASGNNLHIPIFGYFIKRAGGFFIRRKLDSSNQKDLIYRGVMQAYVTEVLKHGQSVEVFIEGTRSRCGLPNYPKTGLLSVLVDAVVEDHVPDVLLVPVSISYEKLFEGNFNMEMIGKPKEKETLWNTMKSIVKMLGSNYGSMSISFGEPRSMKKLLRDIHAYTTSDTKTNTSPLPILNGMTFENCNGNNNKKRRVSLPNSSWRRDIMYLGEHILYKGISNCTLMSTHIVAFLLVNRWRNGVYMPDLVASFSKLCPEITSRKRKLGFSGNPHDVVLNALTLLGEHVIRLEYTEIREENDKCLASAESLGVGDAFVTLENKNSNNSGASVDSDESEFADANANKLQQSLVKTECVVNNRRKISKKQSHSSLHIRPILAIPDMFELVYYANTLTPLYAIESLVCLAVCAVTGYRFSSIQEKWERSGVGIHDDTLPDKVKLSFLRSTLIAKTLSLIDLVHLDLILCDVLDDLQNCVKDAIHDLTLSGCFSSESYGRKQTANLNLDLDEEESSNDDQWLKINLSATSRVLFYQSVLAPHVEGLAVASSELKSVECMTEKEFLSHLLRVALTRSTENRAVRIECCSKHILNQAIQSFKENGILRTDGDTLELGQEYSTSQELDKLHSNICQFMM